MNRWNIYWVLPLITLILVILPVGAVGESDTGSIIAAEGISISVDFGNGTSLDFSDLSGATVLGATEMALDVQVQWYGPLAYIRGIEGIVGEGQYGWQYWVNGEFASIAVNLYSLEDGDSIEWVYSGPVTQTQDDPTLIPGAAIVSFSGLSFLALVYLQTSRRLH